MPSLKYIFQNAIAKDYRLLRGKAIECISLIGLAVGAEKVRYMHLHSFTLLGTSLLWLRNITKATFFTGSQTYFL